MPSFDLRSVLVAWREDCARQHQETLEAVRATAQEQVPFNVQGVSVDMPVPYDTHVIDILHAVPR